jgi:hypothetical protein
MRALGFMLQPNLRSDKDSLSGKMPPIHPLATLDNPAADERDNVEKKAVYCLFVLT